MLQYGHAYIGCHLVDRYFPDIPMDDLQAIRKLADLDEFLVIETTLVTKNVTFSEAEATARTEHLNVDGEFQCAIDIIRARYSGIRPLPLKRSTNGIEFVLPKRYVEKLDKERKRDLQQEVDLGSLSNSSSRSGRVARWAQKLLDLSLRNRLLNVRDTKQIIPIACSDIAVLEDKIAADKSLSLNPLSNLLSEKDLHDISMLRNSEIKSDIKEFLDKELAQHRLWTLLTPMEMSRRLTGLYRQSKTDLEESGVNTLFLALGFLEWKAAERDTKSYLAPILLIPIRLQRKSIAEGIRISRLDMDTVINETLLELLRSQFKLTIPGLNPLPMDESGVNTALIMQIFRQTIKKMKGWEIREEARIGHFSFGKFIMWNDMTTRIDDLKQSPLVKHLISGAGIFDDGIEVFDASEIRNYLKLDQLYCPLSADSSQLAAVLYSQQGKSFVLHGPPGTGKSQTITNIIAHNLALGRRILFVSEKKAALDVVHKRLSSIGLRPFCLELHSNKSGKAEVLTQFSESLQVPEIAPAGEWDSTVHALDDLRNELNGYVSALHQCYPNGLSAYDCLSHLLTCKKTPQEGLIVIDCLTQSKEDFEALEHFVSDLCNAWQGVSPESLEALQELAPADWSPVFEKELLDSIRKLRNAAENLRKTSKFIEDMIHFPDSDELRTIYNSAVLGETLKQAINIPEEFLSDDFREHVAFLKEFVVDFLRNRELTEALKNYHLEKLSLLDFAGIETRIQRNKQAFFLVKFFKNRKLIQNLSSLKKLGGTPLSIAELEHQLPVWEEYCTCLECVKKKQPQAQKLLGKLWNDGEPNWDALNPCMEYAQSVISAVEQLVPSDTILRQQVFSALQKLMPEAEKIFIHNSPMRDRINDLLVAWNDFQGILPDAARYLPAIREQGNLGTVIGICEKIIEKAHDLRNVMLYCGLRNSANGKGLTPLVSALQSGMRFDGKESAKFRDIYCLEMLNQLLIGNTILSGFSGINHEERIRRFRELDCKYTKLTKQMVFAKLAANLPRRRSGPCPEGTELGILKRECEKRARQKPVRLLLEQIPTLAPVLKPCFLMSPLSVAQYLPPDNAAFDLIVFDEASQVPVWDAIGVIARGKQLIVVGDPKQMPPTNFFQKGESEDAEPLPDETEDMESILDECIAAGVHSAYLNWHYRSRHEALISFSNHYYYEDRLYTFPAARSSDRLGVRFEFVPDGIYDRKASRTNRQEANALVKYVFERLGNPKLKQRSIGVVTFSQAQKDLIEDLMEQERAKHPNLEPYFSDQNEEPLFVKNLENVQGDERDVILFSIGYAPDMEGKFSMNFGPLNRQGGERRLNVAITRAKEQVVVFSSIHAADIDLSRTHAVGAAHLKYFLDYAKKGFRIQNHAATENHSEGLTDTIAEFLTSRQVKWERNVGCSGYRIDLAVCHPDHPAEFLLGIECDGCAYASQKTTRDRDHLRDSVLQAMGWNTYRAWSVDWAFDRQRSEERLLALIEELRTKKTEEPAEQPQEPLPEYTSDTTQIADTPPALVSEHRKQYFVWSTMTHYPQESFYEWSQRNTIRNQMLEVVQCEGPICESLLKRRIVKAWGFNRAGDNIQKVLNVCLPHNLESTHIGDDRVFWPVGRPANTYLDYRVAENEESRRTIEEIPPEELANAMHEVLIDFNSCEQDTLYRETIKLFGFTAVTTKARKYLDMGILALKQSGRM